MPSLSQAGQGIVPSAEMPFIVSSSGSRADPATRKFIRSHAMRGRKQKRVCVKKNVLVTSADLVTGSVRTAPVEVKDVICIYTPPDRRIGSDLSFVALPEDLCSSILLNITKGSQ